MARIRTVVFVALFVTSVAGPTAAGADDPPAACAVIDPDTIRCFDTEAEMEAATNTAPGGNGPAGGVDVDAYCVGRSDLWIYLYEGLNMTGRVVKFRDAAMWHNLSTWGFDNITTSWRNTTYCTGHLAEYSNGGGYSITLPARSQSSQVSSSWNDRGSSVYISP